MRRPPSRVQCDCVRVADSWMIQRQYICIDIDDLSRQACWMGTKSSQLQIRVSLEQKVALKRLAADAGLSVSAYVLSTLLPSQRLEFNRRAVMLAGADDHAKAWSDLQLWLSRLTSEEFLEAVASADLEGLPPLAQNLVAAAVEQEAHRKGVGSPAWTGRVDPLERPHFAWSLRSLRPHLMRVTPLVFKRRNVFLAASGDARR